MGMQEMERLKPLDPAAVPSELQPVVGFSEQVMGFTANDVLTMARWPELLLAMAPVVDVIYGPGTVDVGLKRLVGLIASTAAGCRYCEAHTAQGSAAAGIDPTKVSVAWEFETSPLFSPAERAALRVARGGGSHPNGVTDEDFAELLTHFDERAAMEIVGVIALFGFLNRWNDTLATRLEDLPGDIAGRLLEQQNWTAGKHG
jgi:alkylhydroperoxidase family enzyme